MILELIHSSVFYQMAAILIFAGAVGFLAIKLHQPLIVAFIAVGILSGPDLIGLVAEETDIINTLATLGISLLLFMVGLKLDLNLVRTLGGVALATGLGQVTFTAVFGYLICLGFGLDPVTALYVSIALTFSSTIIIVKLLSDKREIDSLHGRIALGFLIVQDIFVVLCMVLLSAFGVGAEENGAESSLWTAILGVLFKGTVMMALLAAFIIWVATPLMNLVARSPELMVKFAVGWAAAFAAVADIMGFSIELGGLLAGVALASTPFRDVISSRLSSLRDFMLLFFFIALGTKINLDVLGAQVVPSLVLSVFVLVGNPLIVMGIMGFMGYRKRTGFLAGLTVAQISEFSLIFMAMGITLGHVSEDMLGMVTLVGLITISLSTYMITYSQHLYGLCEPFLGIFERKTPHRERGESTFKRGRTYDVILFGLGRYGSEIASDILDEGGTVLGLDFDPQAVRQAKQRETRKGFDVAYGDVTDSDFANHLPLDKARWVVCAVPHHGNMLHNQDFRMVLIDSLKAHNFKGRIAMVSLSREETNVLLDKDVDLILTPFPDAARQAVRCLMRDEDGVDSKKAPARS